jgi:transcriptional regulator with XRE-family HTH domain
MPKKNKHTTRRPSYAGFGQRLQAAFMTTDPAVIGVALGIGRATVATYFKDRAPCVAVLSRIAAITKINLDWLILGAGPESHEPLARLAYMVKELAARIAHLEKTVAERSTRG